MDEDHLMQEDLNAAIALSLEGEADWARDYAVMEQEEHESMQLAGSPPIASFMSSSSGSYPKSRTLCLDAEILKLLSINIC